MKMLFCYDGPIKEDINGEYYSSALNDNMFQRYECIASDIRICIRIDKDEKTKPSNDSINLSKDKYKIIKCPNISSVKGIIFEKKNCKKILEEEIKKVDFLVIRLPSMIGNLSLSIAKKQRKPYLVELVGCPWDALWNYNLKGKIIAPYITTITKRNVKNAPYVLYVTNKFLQKRYPTRGKKINCSNVILKNIDYSVLENRISKIKKDQGSPKILTTIAATDVKYKGQQYVIKAISRLKKKGYIFYYHIIGNGNTDFLSKIAKKYGVSKEVKFIGLVPHDKVFGYLDNIDIYIQPSKQEGLPRALIEAMSRACPCIGSKTGGIPELLEPQYIFPKGNSKRLSKILEEYSTEDMINQSSINFNQSREYERNTLKEKREKFYKEFINECVQKKEEKNDKSTSDP